MVNEINDDISVNTDEYETLTDDEFGYETNTNITDEELDNMYDDDIEHIEHDRQDNKYYIGISSYQVYYTLHPPENYFILMNSMSPQLFFKNSYKQSLNYLKEYSIIHQINPKIEILKLQILQDGTYSVIKKTYWLRLIQKHWKKTLLLRQEMFNHRCVVKSYLYFQTNGRYPYGLNHLPTLKGMLCHYNKKQTIL
jgi:hypothetical protein